MLLKVLMKELIAATLDLLGCETKLSWWIILTVKYVAKCIVISEVMLESVLVNSILHN